MIAISHPKSEFPEASGFAKTASLVAAKEVAIVAELEPRT